MCVDAKPGINTCSDRRSPGVVSVGNGAAALILDEHGEIGVGGLGAETQSSSRLLALQTASSDTAGV